MKSQVSQAAHALMMVRPVRFCYNQETAVDNAFMTEIKSSAEATQAKALQEFDNYVSTLKAKGIEVACFEDTPVPHTPDSIFPNNWISFHEDGTIVLYPMKAENRRAERRLDIIEDLEKNYNYKIERRIDISDLEKEEKFLEGTGSIIFDYLNRIAYACVSQRTNKEVLEQISERIGFKAYPFHSVDQNGKEIYHTNVMMCLGERYVMICTQSIQDEEEREALMKSFRDTGHEIVDLTHEQLRHFAGNALEVRNKEGKTFLIISQAGYDILTEEQKEVIRQYDEIVPIPLHIIETNGGGSARCMISDIRLPKRS